MNTVDHFKLLENELPVLRNLSDKPGARAFFAQECMRFYSIAESLRQTFTLTNDTAEERYITHVLGRSLLEGFFWVIYIFDTPGNRDSRYDEKLNAFRREYGKFWNEKIVPDRVQLEPADPNWASMPKPLDVNSMLTQLKNDHGDRLNYLYFVYRVSSFDTHGNSLSTIFEAVFGNSSNFTTLDFKYGFDLIANTYLVIMNELRKQGEI